MITSIAFIMIGVALLIGTIRALFEWRQSTSKSENRAELAQKASVYGVFGVVGNACIGMIVFGIVSVLNHAGE